jgi:hypothetical protein
MKNPIYLLGGLLIVITLAVFNSSGRPEPGPTAGKEAMLEREAVAKVLAAHHFTPPVPLAGPPGFTWYIGARSFTAHSLAEVMVGVRRGANFTVEVTSFKRDREETPWVSGKSTEATIENFEKALRDELHKELALEEKTK